MKALTLTEIYEITNRRFDEYVNETIPGTPECEKTIAKMEAINQIQKDLFKEVYGHDPKDYNHE